MSKIKVTKGQNVNIRYNGRFNYAFGDRGYRFIFYYFFFINKTKKNTF